MKLNECYKLYNCLVTPFTASFEKVIHNITLGYTLLGNLVFEYVYDKDLIDFKGCFIEEGDQYFGNIENIMESDNYSHTSLIPMICKQSKIKLISLIDEGLNRTNDVYRVSQKYALELPFSANLNTSSATVFNNTYTVHNDVFVDNNVIGFLGISDHMSCLAEYIRTNYFPYNFEQITGLNLQNLFLPNVNTTLIEDNINFGSANNDDELPYPVLFLLPVITVATLNLCVFGSIYLIRKLSSTPNGYEQTLLPTSIEEDDIINSITIDKGYDFKEVNIYPDLSYNLTGDTNDGTAVTV